MTGPVPSGIDEVGLAPGSHVCAFYRGDADRDRLLVGYLSAGLTAGDKCICIVDSARTAKRLEKLPGTRMEPGSFDLYWSRTRLLGLTWAFILPAGIR